MLIYTRCYNKHSIAEYLINSISIYHLFVCQDGLNRPGQPLCAVGLRIPSRVQYMIMS